jgi:hypothetical protein
MQNKPNFRKAQMNISTVNTKGYENNRLGERPENKPNSNPTCRSVASGEAGSNPISKAKKC